MSILSKVNIAFVIDPLALLGCGIASGATIALAIRLWPTPRPAVKAETTDPLPLETKPQWPEATMPIQTFDTLLDSTGTASFIDQARQGCGLNEATWSNFILPVVRNVAELVQLLPASESHHHAQPGGLWIHTCETLCYAIRLRQGTILPSGRDAEDQSHHRHRWTAGVIIAALLHDVGKTIKDLRVRLYSPNHRGSPWNALTGDMLATQATDYAVDFPKAARDCVGDERAGTEIDLARLARREVENGGGLGRRVGSNQLQHAPHRRIASSIAVVALQCGVDGCAANAGLHPAGDALAMIDQGRYATRRQRMLLEHYCQFAIFGQGLVGQ